MPFHVQYVELLQPVTRLSLTRNEKYLGKYYGAAWLFMVRRCSYGAAWLLWCGVAFMVRRGSVDSALACCKTGPSSILGSAPQGGFSH